MPARSVDLVKGQRAIFAPPVRARLAARARASPWLLGIASAAWFGAPLGLACVPHLHLHRCMHLHLPGAGVPTQGTSHWGHPLGESSGGAQITDQ
jgi:hypothetical protein